MQTDSGTPVPVIRVSFHTGWEKKIEVLKPLIEHFNPDWISLQYVPYTFHNRGLPFELPKQLVKLGAGFKWHIMFHELWIGISTISPFKHKLVGYFQRQIAKSIIKHLAVKVFSTSNILYQKVLEKAGISATILPLFSSVPVINNDTAFLSNVLQQLEIEDNERERWILAGIFGNLYPDANLHAALSELLEQSLQEQKQVAFIGFGRMNETGTMELKRLEDLFSNNIRFLYLGEQPLTHVSYLLQLLDYGISCTPAQHIGKSSVYAAMKRHGLQVLLPSYIYLPEYDAVVKEYQKVVDSRTPDQWSVEYVALQFINLLSSYSQNTVSN